MTQRLVTLKIHILLQSNLKILLMCVMASYTRIPFLILAANMLHHQCLHVKVVLGNVFCVYTIMSSVLLK
jgi:hypothetical protein